jgi:hypothetical protein
MPELLTFQTFAGIDEAKEAAEILEKNGIATVIAARNGRQLDAIMIGNDYGDKITLKIAGSDFTLANELLYNAPINLTEVATNHPVLSLSNQELLEILSKPDEWGSYNYRIAKALLAERGIAIAEPKLKKLNEERTAILAERKNLSPMLLLAGYASSLVNLGRLFFYVEYAADYHSVAPSGAMSGAVWYFPGFFGLVLGAIVMSAKNTLPTGDRTPVYTAGAIKHGMAMFALNAVAWLINIVAYASF